LDYLAREEINDFDVFDLQRAPAPLCDSFMPVIIRAFKEDREYIEKRLSEGKADDTPDDSDEQSEKEMQELLPGVTNIET
jgi:hypothetical protein